MNVALCHDFLIEFGGAEKVLQVLLRMYPNAHVYTSFVDPQIVKNHFPNLSKRNLHVSFIERMRLGRLGYLFQTVAPLVWKSFNVEKFDVVISNSSYLMCNLVRVQRPIHIQLIQSLPKNIFGFDSTTRFERFMAPYVIREYTTALRRSTHIIVNSKHVQQTLLTTTGVRSEVIYPPVSIPSRYRLARRYDYYLIVSRLDASKSIELAIQACNNLHLPLKIVGKSGNADFENYLRSIAGDTIEFFGFLEGSSLEKMYSKAIAFIFTNKNEDFGIAPVEAMAHGVPVIAYYGGGVKETVRSGKTGIFFYEHSVSSLEGVLKRFDPRKFNSRIIRAHALQYRESIFKKKFMDYVQKAYRDKQK